MENQVNKSSRRDFLKKSSLAGIGLSTAFISSTAQASEKVKEQEIGKLNESSKELLALFNLKYRFFQAAPGGGK